MYDFIAKQVNLCMMSGMILHAVFLILGFIKSHHFVKRRGHFCLWNIEHFSMKFADKIFHEYNHEKTKNQQCCVDDRTPHKELTKHIHCHIPPPVSL